MRSSQRSHASGWATAECRRSCGGGSRSGAARSSWHNRKMAASVFAVAARVFSGDPAHLRSLSSPGPSIEMPTVTLYCRRHPDVDFVDQDTVGLDAVPAELLKPPRPEVFEIAFG